MTETAGNGKFDHEALDRRYAEERDKRLRGEGNAQYVAIAEGSPFAADPFASTPAPREPLTDEVDVVVVGGGIAGLLTAVHLRKEGVDNFRLLEKGADLGGTWYWNRYPGVACDVESYVYLPLLEELGYVPSERYAKGHEIWDYLRLIADRFGIYENTDFQTRVERAHWSEDTSRWTVETDRGDQMNARELVLGTGALLHRPKLPGVPGIETFAGKSFHTSRWDYDYTGGDSSGNLTGLADKRVAIFGTGATGVQCVPHLARHAQHLYVFQRTPSVVDLRANQKTDPEWAAGLAPGWHRERQVNFDAILAGLPGYERQVDDQWSVVWGLPEMDGADPDPARLLGDKDLEQMERVRRRIDEIVEDPATAEALKPYFGVRCKRPCFNDEYLASYNQANVTLVHTDGRGPDRIVTDAIEFDDRRYEVDCIIYATGFESATSPDRAGGIEVVGRTGSLAERWADGVKTVHGIHAHDFPNMFIVGGVRGGAGTINASLTYEEQAKHAAAMIAGLLEEGIEVMDVSQETEQRWAQVLEENSIYVEEQWASCTPGYYNNEGKLDESTRPLFASVYGGGFLNYYDILAEWRRTGWREELEAQAR